MSSPFQQVLHIFIQSLVFFAVKEFFLEPHLLCGVPRRLLRLLGLPGPVYRFETRLNETLFSFRFFDGNLPFHSFNFR